MKIKYSAITILDHLRTLINELEQQELQLPLAVFSGSSIGQHTRHILEFYICLINQVDDLVVSYDKRARDTNLENNKEYILLKIDEIIHDLHPLATDFTIILSTELSGKNHLTPSSFSREILYTIEHAVHHMAIIKIGVLLNFPKISFDKNFGVAESTLRYIEEN
tara:strand:- start:4517 stop:5011 length:495 start_codon:yes stop_codon:yes gene_type:complete